MIAGQEGTGWGNSIGPAEKALLLLRMLPRRPHEVLDRVTGAFEARRELGLPRVSRCSPESFPEMSRKFREWTGLDLDRHLAEAPLAELTRHVGGVRGSLS